MTSRNGRAKAGGFLKDFGDFLMQGNVVDLAVAVVIGGAFGKIIGSLVEDIITPALLNPAMKKAGVDELSKLSINGIKYGSFLATVLNFVVIAFVIFLLIRSFEQARKKMQRKQEMAEEITPDPALEANERLIASIDQLNQTLRERS
ncbi:large conductance mechanosensitive channel protein MscL [Acaryochloris sp. CCMEE 5410]|uniref:large conductance mechanosensitive channel protein MscL n=1 Tax=Acaryochloris sp. CCMEE 5410 TaxID=310037 RepID=UPI0002F48AED|nr:large conductance mechanosensitive channel protein MscL [Acaryochloris sp. CCMEE 5410]KAI9130769.1 large conductance mechanosensitive channel protein MscL [Acaryochloris sp. CCMEE 5410]